MDGKRTSRPGPSLQALGASGARNRGCPSTTLRVVPLPVPGRISVPRDKADDPPAAVAARGGQAVVDRAAQLVGGDSQAPILPREAFRRGFCLSPQLARRRPGRAFSGTGKKVAGSERGLRVRGNPRQFLNAKLKQGRSLIRQSASGAAMPGRGNKGHGIEGRTGVFLAFLALAIATVGMWAAWYFSPERVYRRQLSAERRMRRHRAN